MKKTKILYVFCFEDFSGAEIVTERLIYHNVEMAEAIVLCPSGVFTNRLRANDVRVFNEKRLVPMRLTDPEIGRFQLFYRLFLAIVVINFRLIQILIKNPINIVHSTNLSCSFYILPSVLISRIFNFKTKFVWSNHDLTYFSGKLGDRMAKLCINVFHHTITVSNAVRLKFQKLMHKISVLYNGLDLRKFTFSSSGRLGFREKYSVEPNVIAVGILGNVVEHKGHLFLINALEKINTQVEFKIFIIGKIADKNSDFSRRLGQLISDRPEGSVVHIEHTEQIIDVYSGLDLVVNVTLSSIQEPLGTTIYEAMALNRVVIASKTGGSSEIIDHGENGFLFEADNENDFCSKFEYVLENINSMHHIRSSARKKVECRFDVNVMQKNYNNIIDKLQNL